MSTTIISGEIKKLPNAHTTGFLFFFLDKTPASTAPATQNTSKPNKKAGSDNRVIFPSF